MVGISFVHSNYEMVAISFDIMMKHNNNTPSLSAVANPGRSTNTHRVFQTPSKHTHTHTHAHTHILTHTLNVTIVIQNLLQVLLQILDDGRSTDTQGHTVSFKNTVIIMTSNLGSAEIFDQLAKPTDKAAEEGKGTRAVACMCVCLCVFD